MASEKDLLPVMNHLKSIEGRLDKMVAKPGKNQNQSKSPSSSAASTPSATPPPTPPPQQQSWRPRNPQSNQRFSGQGQQQQRPPAFQLRTFQPQTGRFPAPGFQNAPQSPCPWRPPGAPRVFVPSNSSGTARATAPGTCYVCGTPGCHTRFLSIPSNVTPPCD